MKCNIGAPNKSVNKMAASQHLASN